MSNGAVTTGRKGRVNNRNAVKRKTIYVYSDLLYRLLLTPTEKLIPTFHHDSNI